MVLLEFMVISFIINCYYSFELTHLVLSELKFLLDLHLGATHQGLLAYWAGVFIFQPGQDALFVVAVSTGQLDYILVLLELTLANGATIFRAFVFFVLQLLELFSGETF